MAVQVELVGKGAGHDAAGGLVDLAHAGVARSDVAPGGLVAARPLEAVALDLAHVQVAGVAFAFGRGFAYANAGEVDHVLDAPGKGHELGLQLVAGGPQAAARPGKAQLGLACGFGLEAVVGDHVVVGVDGAGAVGFVRGGGAEGFGPVAQQVKAVKQAHAGAHARGKVRFLGGFVAVADFAVEVVIAPAELEHEAAVQHG